MAKGKKSKATPRRRRRSISGMGGGNITTLLSMVGGAVIGRIAAKKLEGKIDGKILNAGMAVAGYFGGNMVRNPILKGMATGVAITGTVGVLSSMGVISAISGTEDIQLEYVSGDDPLAELAGADNDTFANMNGLNDEGTFSGTDELSILSGDMDDEY